MNRDQSTDDSHRRYKRVRAGRPDWLSNWWREATGPIRLSQHRSMARAIGRRLYLWTPVIVLALIIAGAIGFLLFTGFRARDLTAKALINAEEGNARTARLQIFSAMGLRPDDPSIKRAAALIESRLGNPEAVEMWGELEAGAPLSADEIDARAEVMTFHGDDEQFAAALSALEKSGASERAARLRSERSLHGGDMDEAIGQARSPVEGDDDPRLRLRLLQLLAVRHGPLLRGVAQDAPGDVAAAAEMAGLIDELAETPVGDEALALGLRAPFLPATKKSAWAAAAMKNKSASNPALLPAAEFLATSGAETPQELYNQLNISFIGAPLPMQAAFARWMLQQGMNEQVIVTASAEEAVKDEGIFRAHAAALAELGRWQDLKKLGDTPSKTPMTVRQMVQARAARELGRTGESKRLARSALQISVAENRVGQAIEMADLQGQRDLADEAVVEMCGNPAVADGAFRLARDRFGRRGQFASLEAAKEKAAVAAPQSLVLADYRRFQDLLAGKTVDPQETSAAVAADPKNGDLRITHALALLKAGRATDALAVFDRFDVFVENLPAEQQAVAIAVLAANGRTDLAVPLARKLDPQLLPPGAYALISPLRAQTVTSD